MKPLGEIVKILKGGKAPEVFDRPTPGAYPYLQIEDLRPNATPKYAIDKDGILARKTDVLIAWDGANAGTVSFDLEGYIGSTIAILRPTHDEIHAPYLGYFLRSKFNEIQGNTTGATIPHVNRGYLENLRLSIPPLPEQRRIASLLARADHLRRLRRVGDSLSTSLLQSVFLEMFGDPVRNEKGWERVSIADLGKVQTGNTPSREEPEHFGCFIEWIKSDNIVDGQMYISRSREMLSKIGLRKGRSVNAGAVLMTCIAGSLNHVGDVAITNRKVSFNQQINAVSPNPDVNSLFLYGMFTIAKPYVQYNATAGMKHIITKSKLEELVMIKPPLPEQERFAAVVQRVESLRKRQAESARQGEQLFQTLLAQSYGW